MTVPVDNNYIRNLITKDEVLNIIDSIKDIKPVESEEKNMENLYKEMLENATHEDFIKIIKTTYLRNKQRENSGKKISDKDDKYFKMAEDYLYNEFSVVLNLSYDETKKFVINSVLFEKNN